MTDINRLLADLGLSPAELARRLGVSEAAVSRWRSGRHAPQGLYAARLAELEATAAIRRATAPGLDLAALIAGLLDHAAPPLGPEAAEYERGYRDGYRAAISTALGALAEPYRAIRTATITEQPHDRADHH